ncbi:MAG: hypothetical protein D6756_01520, partial [Cyanobacteria bacterium J083]
MSLLVENAILWQWLPVAQDSKSFSSRPYFSRFMPSYWLPKTKKAASISRCSNSTILYAAVSPRAMYVSEKNSSLTYLRFAAIEIRES